MAQYDPNIPLPSYGGDSAARAIGFSDISAYNNAKAQYESQNRGNISGVGAGGGNSPTDPLALAQAAQNLQVQANQPAIQTLQGQQSSLKDQYQKLLDSITASEQPALNSAISAANTNLAKRGITSDSAYGAANIAQAQLPVTTATGQQLAQTGVSEAQDVNTLAAQIASLQAGNVGNALGFGQGVNSGQLGLQGAQAQAAAQIRAAEIGGTAKPFTSMQTLTSPILNTSTGQSGFAGGGPTLH